MSVILAVLGLFLLFIPAVMADRTIYGVVINGSTIMPLNEATVRYGRRKVKTNSAGSFTAHVPKDADELLIEHPDFEPQKVKVDAKTTYIEVSLSRKTANMVPRIDGGRSLM